METKDFYSRENEEVAQQVRDALACGYQVIWRTAFETFYGVCWSSWAAEQVKDIPCAVEYKNPDKWYGYYRTLVITPNK